MQEGSSRSGLAQFFTGLILPLHATRLILSRPKLLSLAALPVLLALIILSSFIFLFLGALHAWILAKLGLYFGVALQVLLALALVFVSFQIIVSLVNLLAIPFNDWLAENTERASGVTPPARAGFGYYFRMMRLDLAKTSLNLMLTLLFTLGTWVPVVGIIFFLGMALLNTLNFVSYPQSRRLMSIGDSFTWLNQNKARSLGFGIAISLLFSIPFVNILALPVAVVGGTLLYLEK